VQYLSRGDWIRIDLLLLARLHVSGTSHFLIFPFFRPSHAGSFGNPSKLGSFNLFWTVWTPFLLGLCPCTPARLSLSACLACMALPPSPPHGPLFQGELVPLAQSRFCVDCHPWEHQGTPLSSPLHTSPQSHALKAVLFRVLPSLPDTFDFGHLS
jgi:hypothetical protein